MAKFRVTYQLDGKSDVEQFKPSEFWPFVVATDALAEDADLAERAVRLHRIKAACRYLSLASVSYLLEGRSMEIHC